ncbi:MAG TPA: alpha/beta fold hydrolase, partial [Burkholderiales bacterium]|nr:alpha/beta fold hydrolase [Burkholderiales bacterium]
GTLYGSGERAALILPATGVPQSYYAKFASYLAGRGFSVLTFDYRGIGRSLSGDIRKLGARMQDWALLDAAAALAFLSARKVSIVGHSFGGQALGLLPEPERIAAALIVGSQSGYWRNWPALGQAWMWPATHFALPGVANLLGYFPAKRLGFGEDLPKGVALQWASWCRHPRYLVGALGVEDAYARLRAPLRAYAISDDPFAPLRAVEALAALYPNCPWETRKVVPRELGVKSLGHFGFFRERFRDSLWRESANWLENR